MPNFPSRNFFFGKQSGTELDRLFWISTFPHLPRLPMPPILKILRRGHGLSSESDSTMPDMKDCGEEEEVDSWAGKVVLYCTGPRRTPWTRVFRQHNKNCRCKSTNGNNAMFVPYLVIPVNDI
jgi:hypothetical protein